MNAEDPVVPLGFALAVVFVLPSVLVGIDDVLAENNVEVLFRVCQEIVSLRL
jgi:hypothetical protein